MFATTTITVALLPAKSTKVTFSDPFDEKTFVKTLLLEDRVQPETCWISSLAVIVAVTFWFVIDDVLSTIFAVGAVLSIFATITVIVALLPNVSRTVTCSAPFAVNFFVNCFLFEDRVQPETPCISSLAVIVAVTSLFVFKVVL